MFQWRLKEVLTKFAGLYISDHFWHCVATWNCVTYLFQYVIILKISIFSKKIWCYLRANNDNKGKIWRARVSKFRSETERVWRPVTIVTVVVYILNSKDVQGVTLTMDRKYWLFGGITAAVISGAYVFWTSSSKSNKKKGKILVISIATFLYHQSITWKIDILHIRLLSKVLRNHNKTKHFNIPQLVKS